MSGFLGAGDGRAGSVAQVAHRVREEHSLRRGSVILELVPKLFWFLCPGTLTSGGDGPVHMGAGTPGAVLWEALCGPSGCRVQSCGACDLPPCRCRPVRGRGEAHPEAGPVLPVFSSDGLTRFCASVRLLQNTSGGGPPALLGNVKHTASISLPESQ